MLLSHPSRERWSAPLRVTVSFNLGYYNSEVAAKDKVVLRSELYSSCLRPAASYEVVVKILEISFFLNTFFLPKARCVYHLRACGMQINVVTDTLKSKTPWFTIHA